MNILDFPALRRINLFNIFHQELRKYSHKGNIFNVNSYSDSSSIYQKNLEFSLTIPLLSHLNYLSDLISYIILKTQMLSELSRTFINKMQAPNLLRINKY